MTKDEVDAIIHKVFIAFCKLPDEMDMNDFKKMCRELELSHRKFTSTDAEMVFRRSIAKVEALPEGNALKAGVIFGKRVNYDVFREVVIGATAHARATALDDIVLILRDNLEKYVKRNEQVLERPMTPDSNSKPLKNMYVYEPSSSN